MGVLEVGADAIGWMHTLAFNSDSVFPSERYLYL